MNPAARVVPDVASFSVDDGFWYSVPDHLSDRLTIGSIVRVPLSGRRVRGWVVQLAPDRPGDLKEIASISGEAAVFDRRLLDSLTWAARHYVAPVSSLLARAGPPNLPRAIPTGQRGSPGAASASVLDPIAHRSARRLNTPVTAIVASWHDLDWLGSCGQVLNGGQSVLVVASSVAEVDRLEAAASEHHAKTVVAVRGRDDASDARMWELAQSSPRLVIGTPKTALWKVARLGLAIVLEEGRRAMKDRQTPTLHVRDVLRTRSRLEGFNLVFFGPTPSVELLAAGAELVRPGNRAWSHVEVVDRSDDPPSSGFLSSRVIAAITASVEAGRSVFVFTHRRVDRASVRCSRCRALRMCGSCGSRIGRVERCPRCGTNARPCLECGAEVFEEMGTIPERLVAELDRRIGPGVAKPGYDAPVAVGTERDLASLGRVEVAVAADVDGMLLGTGYRTAEEALRQLARLASMVGPSSGSRLMIQTSKPDSPIVTTMRRGNPIPFLERVLVERAREGFPPSTDMIALELRGEVPDSVTHDLADLDGRAVVMGPMEVADGQRWLLMGELGEARAQLRRIVGRWRDRGATVRVDVDPIDV